MNSIASKKNPIGFTELVSNSLSNLRVLLAMCYAMG